MSIVGYLSILAIILLLRMILIEPELNRGEEQPRRTVCMSNLKQIGLALEIYSHDHNDNFPKNLSQIYPEYATDLIIFICPEKTPSISKEDVSINFNICYEYVSGMTNKYDRNCIIVFDKKGNHKRKTTVWEKMRGYPREENTGRNVCFVNTHVRWIPEEKLETTWQTHLSKLRYSRTQTK